MAGLITRRDPCAITGCWVAARQLARIRPHSLELARTAAFTVLVLTQLFNCFNARSSSESAFRSVFKNHWLWAAVGLSAALQGAVVHLPFLNLAFGTVPLSVGQWGVCVAMASGVLWFSEGRKLVRRGLHWTSDGPRASLRGAVMRRR